MLLDVYMKQDYDPHMITAKYYAANIQHEEDFVKNRTRDNKQKKLNCIGSLRSYCRVDATYMRSTS